MTTQQSDQPNDDDGVYGYGVYDTVEEQLYELPDEDGTITPNNKITYDRDEDLLERVVNYHGLNSDEWLNIRIVEIRLADELDEKNVEQLPSTTPEKRCEN